MFRARLAALSLVLFLTRFAAAAAPLGPSFDCAKAATPVEHAICADPRLSAADLTLSEAYTEALAAAGPYPNDLLAFERAWLKRRGAECGITSFSPEHPPDSSDGATCLLGLIAERARTLKPPEYGYMRGLFFDLRTRPPLTLWMLNEAFAEMPFAPRAAEHVFASIEAGPAQLGELMTARLFDPPSRANTQLQQDLAARLHDASHDQFMLPDSYDGSLSALASYMVSYGTGLQFPCIIFARFPDLIGATGAAFGSTMDNFVPGAACSDYEYPYPVIARALSVAASPYDGGAFGRCSGTVRFAAFANVRMDELVSRVAPTILLKPGINPRDWARLKPSGITLPPVPNGIPLESWSYQSVWNRRAFAAFKSIFDKAAIQFASMYQTRWGFSHKDAERAAHVALWLPLLWTNEAPPPRPISVAIMSANPTRALQPFLVGKLTKPEKGEPLLSLAVDNTDAIKSLLAAHLDVNAMNGFGKTPLMTAAQFDRSETMSLLIKGGARVNEKTIAPEDIPNNDTQAGDGRGVGCADYHILHGSRTALIYAAANASIATIRQLLAAGADKTLKDSTGLSALDYLQGRGPGPPNPRLNAADRSEAAKLLALP